MEKIYTMMATFFAGMYDRAEDEGATVVEYALIVALVSIASLAVWQLLGPAIAAAFQEALDAF